jgi:hypothetical protein|tara:strand:+ start:1183 stop:1386 length:204 start_codon:yes stop_codon:yes gene_type:complete
MKKVSTKQNQRHIRLMKKRTRKSEIRKERREEVMAQMLIIKQSHKRIARTQRKMSKLAKQAAASRAL